MTRKDFWGGIGTIFNFVIFLVMACGAEGWNQWFL